MGQKRPSKTQAVININVASHYFMKEKLEDRLKCLVGRTLTKTARTLNLQMFHFDKLAKTSDEVGQIAIHIMCEWRIVGSGPYVGSQDIKYDKEGRYDKDINWDLETYRDRLLIELLKRNTLVVDNVSADDFGGFEIHFDKKSRLQVIPMSGSRDWVNEYWRIFDTNDKTTDHFVVTSRGIQK
jgi:hypothetical protein